MKAELKAKWLAGLRSGEFPQGTGYLEKDGKYCCMGVLCIVAKVPREADGYFLFYDGSSNATVMGELRAQVNGSRVAELTCMNDLEGKSFAEIADWIETHIPEEAS